MRDCLKSGLKNGSSEKQQPKPYGAVRFAWLRKLSGIIDEY